jgi:hypothetical protein
MKTLLSLANGAFTITEEGGVFTFSFNDQAALGGGEAAGVASVKGSGSLVLSGKQAFDLGMKLLEAHSPAAMVPLEQGVQAVADAAIADA